MAELIVKAIDHRMPTVAEWRARVTAQAAVAQAFLAAHPRAQEAIDIRKRVEGYVSAKQQVVAHNAEKQKTGKGTLSDLQAIELTAAVDAYEAAPAAPADIQMAVQAHYTKPEKRQVIDGASVQVEAEVPSVVTMHAWHKGVLADAAKYDAVKAVELETKDRRGCYKRGYVVAIHPDGTRWGACECLPKFVVLKFPGLAVDDPALQQFMQPEMEDQPDEKGTVQYRRRRQHQIQFDDLPKAAAEKLDTDGVLTVDKGGDLTWDTFIGCVFDHKAGKTVKVNG